LVKRFEVGAGSARESKADGAEEEEEEEEEENDSTTTSGSEGTETFESIGVAVTVGEVWVSISGLFAELGRTSGSAEGDEEEEEDE
jgi:hypothetical protein